MRTPVCELQCVNSSVRTNSSVRRATDLQCPCCAHWNPAARHWKFFFFPVSGITFGGWAPNSYITPVSGRLDTGGSILPFQCLDCLDTGFSIVVYGDTELKPRTKKVDFLTKKIERMAFVPCDRYGSRASKNGRMSFRSPPMLRNMHLKVLKMAIFPYKKGRLRGGVQRLRGGGVLRSLKVQSRP